MTYQHIVVETRDRVGLILAQLELSGDPGGDAVDQVEPLHAARKAQPDFERFPGVGHRYPRSASRYPAKLRSASSFVS
jgi:hypothetical protein